MSGSPPSTPPPTPPPPPSQPPQPEGERPPEGRPQPAAQPQPFQIPPHLWAQLVAGRAPGLGPFGVGTPMPVFTPVAGRPVAGSSIAQQTIQVWQGQYPPPDSVEHYEKILPGAFDRMISMAERLQAAQIEESKRTNEFTQADNRRGHWLGFSTAVIAMFCALGALALGSHVVAGIFISVPVMGVARALIESVRRLSPADLLAATVGNNTQGTQQPSS